MNMLTNLTQYNIMNSFVIQMYQTSGKEKEMFDWVLYSHDQLYKDICMQNHNDDTIKTSATVL